MTLMATERETDTAHDDDAFDADEIRDILDGDEDGDADGADDGAPEDDLRAAGREALAAVDDETLEAELARGLDDEDDTGDANALGDDEVATALEGADGEQAEEGEEGEDDGADGGVEGAGDGGGEAAQPADSATVADAGSGAASGWSPLIIGADRSAVPISEAQVQRRDGHVFLAIPEAEFGRFQARMGRGVVAEKVWRDLDAAKKDVEAERAAIERDRQAIAAASREQIEYEETMAVIKPFLSSILDERDIELLEAKIEARVLKEGRQAPSPAAAAGTAPAVTPVAATPQETAAPDTPTIPWEEQQAHEMGHYLLEIVKENPELHGLTEAQVRAVYHTLWFQERDAVCQRDTDGFILIDTQTMYDRLRAQVAPAPVTTTPADDAAGGTAAASDPTPASTAPRQPAATADKATAFNRGVDAAARPATTSVKAGRTQASSTRPGTAATRDTATRARPQSDEDIQREADDEWDAMKRSLRSSRTLDLDDE